MDDFKFRTLEESLCTHRNQKCVGDNGVVCDDCGKIIVDGRRPDVILLERIEKVEREVERISKLLGGEHE